MIARIAIALLFVQFVSAFISNISVPSSYIEALCRSEGCDPSECRVWLADEGYKAQCLQQEKPTPGPLTAQDIVELCNQANCFPLECKIHYDDDFTAKAKCLKRVRRC